MQDFRRRCRTRKVGLVVERKRAVWTDLKDLSRTRQAFVRKAIIRAVRESQKEE